MAGILRGKVTKQGLTGLLSLELGVLNPDWPLTFIELVSISGRLVQAGLQLVICAQSCLGGCVCVCDVGS